MNNLVLGTAETQFSTRCVENCLAATQEATDKESLTVHEDKEALP
jgi:hypothetical protein